VTIDVPVGTVPAVTLRRTDTTLDLSHKGRKR
jgi:Flp pilus assembly secretin CpaC